MRRLLTITLLAACSAFAQTQSQPTVFFKAFSAAAAIGISANARMIGQQYHHLDVYGTGSGCTNGGISMEGSNDNTTWVTIGVVITSLNPMPSGAAYAASAHTDGSDIYPYVRINYSSLFGGSPGACAITAYYTGTLSGSNISSAPFTAINDSFTYKTAKYSTMSTPFAYTCPNLNAPQIYALVVNAAGGANYITISASTNLTTVWSFSFEVAANASLVLPQGTRPYFFSPEQYGISEYQLNFSQTTATEVDYAISYRCE